MSSLGVLGSGSATTAGTTLAVTNTSGATIPAGTVLVLAAVFDNTATTTAPSVTGSAPGSSAWVARLAPTGQGQTTTAGSGIWLAVWSTRTLADIAAGATITTLTSNQSAVKRAAIVIGLDGADPNLRGTPGGGGSTSGVPSAVTSGTALVPGDHVVGIIGTENGVIPTGDTDTLNGTWSAIAGQVATAGASSSNLAVAAQVKVVTATGAQTYNPTGANDARAYVLAFPSLTLAVGDLTDAAAVTEVPDLLLEPFTGTDGTLPAGWSSTLTAGNPGATIQGNALANLTGATQVARYDALATPAGTDAPQSAELAWTAIQAGVSVFTGPAVLVPPLGATVTTTDDLYVFSVSASTQSSAGIRRKDAASATLTTLGASVTVPNLKPGDVLRLDYVPDPDLTTYLIGYINGVEVIRRDVALAPLAVSGVARAPGVYLGGNTASGRWDSFYVARRDLTVTEGPPAPPPVNPELGSVGTTVAYATGANLAVPVPAGVAAGNLIAAVIYIESDTPITPPDGTWTQTALAENDTSGLSHRLYLFTKIAAGADSGSYTFTHASAPRAGYALRFTGNDTTTPLEAAVTTARAGGSNTHTPLSLTTTVDGELNLYVADSYQQASSWTPPAGYTEVAEVSAIEAAVRVQVTAGDTGGTTGTSSTTSALSAILTSIRPASTAPPPVDLVVDNLTAAPTVEAAPLVQAHNLAVADATLPSTAGAPTVAHIAAGPYVTAVRADSPRVHYRLNETAGLTVADISGNRYDGTFSAPPTWNVAGALPSDADTAVTFPSGPYIAGPAMPNLPAGASLTLAGWVRIEATPAARHYSFIGIGESSTVRATFVARRNATNNRVALWDSTNGWREANYTLPPTEWHYLAVVAAGSNVTFYVDGVELNTVTTGPLPAMTAPRLSVGANHAFAGATDVLTGAGDEVAYFPTALTAARLAAHVTAAGVVVNTDLAVDPLATAATVDPVPVSVSSTLAVNGLTTTGTLDAAGITQAHQLAPAALTVTPVADPVALTQAHQLATADLVEASTLEASGITTTTTLAPAALTLAATLGDAGALSQLHNLLVAGATSSPTVDPSLITTVTTIAPADLATAPTLGAPVLGQLHNLTVAAVTLSPELEEPGVTSSGSIAPAAATVTPTLGVPLLTQVHALAVDDLQLGAAATPAAISQEHHLAPHDLLEVATVDEPLLEQLHELAVDDLAANALLDELGVLEQLEPLPLTHVNIAAATLPDLDVKRTRVSTLGTVVTGPTRTRTAGATVGRVRMGSARLDQ